MNAGGRLASIDIFRAATMMLMIFVNDLWTLNDIPEWLGHVKAGEDGMGLADVVFPAFLFIVGLSIPMAVKARRNKGESDGQIALHIVKRSLALIVMGVFMVNHENISGSMLPISKAAWQILMAVAFILIWNDYPNKRAFGKLPQWVLQLAGVAVLLYLAVIYKSGDPANPEWMRVRWWGILGLIGWAYLYVSLIYLAVGDRPVLAVLALLLLYGLNINEEALWLGDLSTSVTVVSASNHASVMSGVVASLLLAYAVRRDRQWLFFGGCLLTAGALFLFGFLSRPEWGINKIDATPSWTAICAGISFLCFAAFYLLSDRLGLVKWAAILAPAGRSTLTCYLVPYWFYPLFLPTIAVLLPAAMFSSYLGIIKSLLFALIVILITGLLEKLHMRLKI